MKKIKFLEEVEKTKLSHFSLSKPLKMKKSWVNQEVKPFLDNPNHELMIKKELRTERDSYLINNPRMFNLGTDDLAIKPYIPHKSLFQ